MVRQLITVELVVGGYLTFTYGFHFPESPSPPDVIHRGLHNIIGLKRSYKRTIEQQQQHSTSCCKRVGGASVKFSGVSKSYVIYLRQEHAWPT